MDPHTKINTLSICSGIAGLDLGVELATGGAARPVCFVEREAFASAILAKRMEEKAVAAAPIWSDLRTFDGKPWRGVVDCITGGYPCQPFSSAGKRLGEDDPRHLWPEIRRITKEIEPRFVFFENVAGHLSLGLTEVLRDLERMGFRYSAGLFTAAEVGASHRRERVFILGVRNNIGVGNPENDNWGSGKPTAQAGIRKEQKRGRRFASAGASVANARGYGLQGRGAEEGQPVRGCGNEVADTVSNRSQGIDETRTATRTIERSGGSELPDFPPGPGDFDAWRRILEQHKELSPSIEREFRGVVDGAAARVDRLRALGNGVVPLVAAYAFLSLYACIRRES